MKNRTFWKSILIAGLIAPYLSIVDAQVIAPRNVTATTTWSTLLERVRESGGASAIIDEGSSGSVWIVRYAGACADISGNAGTRLSRASGASDPAGWFFDPRQEKWTAQVCVKSETGSVVLRVNEW